MTTPTSGELALLRTQPHKTRLYLSIFEPQTVFAAQVNDAGAAKGDKVITYNNVTAGNFLAIGPGMTLYVGSTAGARDKGSIFVIKADATTITVGENSHINWADDDFLTTVNFHQIWPVYPRYVQDGEEITVYKIYDIAYADQNEDLGSFLVMGSNYAGFINQTSGSCQVYWDGSECENVQGTTGSTYTWSFEGGDPTGSSAITPGWVTYDTAGHYRTLLRVDTPLGGADIGVRHVSIYERPGEGENVPILSWGMQDFNGSRDEGGYTSRIWIKENVESIVDGALVVIFADDWYGTTQQSIGGNSTNRESIVFSGYILDGSIEYDYQTSTVSFDVGSPSEIMKMGEAFSVSVQDSNDPDADAANKNKGGDPWFYLVGLSVKTALYHYIRWHSSVYTLMDIRYTGTDFDIQYFDADRTSLYDAVDSILKSAVYGKAVCDRQGALYFEIDDGAVNNAASTLNKNMFVDNHDWMGTPSITERYVDEISYLEMGGVAYSGGGSGTWSALLSAAPGNTPGYRGKNLKVSGLALTSQGQLNTLVGNIWENMNSDFPELSLDLVGNFRNIDIAPQEIITVTLQSDDTFRGLSWEQKAFTPTAMRWSYDSQVGTFLPNVTLEEVTQGNAGQTIAIPVAPPDEGFDQPPLPVPPPIPPIPVPPLDWSIGLGYWFVPAIGGNDGAGSIRGWLDGTIGATIQGVNIETDGTAGGVWGVPDGVTSITAIPVVANNDPQQTIGIITNVFGYHYLETGSYDSDSVSADHTFTANELNWLTNHELNLAVTAGDILVFRIESADSNSELAAWGWWLSMA
jgi:hypothetical protein